MKVTTVRFSEDLWATIQAEAEVAGVSASQFIREAALARAAAAAGARREVAGLENFENFPMDPFVEETTVDDSATGPAKTREAAGALRAESEALRAQSRQAQRAAAAKLARAFGTTRPI